ncbi:hypothetical protein HCB17_25010 [Salinispora arenicola]|nr:hypothetical protein [Salinispora arenicola]
MPLVTRAADAATAAYQQEIFWLQREVQLLRDEVRHCYDVIDVMGCDLRVQPNARTEARAFYWKVYADVLDDLWDVGRPPDEER